MIEPFPISLANNRLTRQDFFFFSKSFAEILTRLIPTARLTSFFYSVEEFKPSCENLENNTNLQSEFYKVKSAKKTCSITGTVILLPFEIEDADRVIAIVEGDDEAIVRRMSTDWLLETKDRAEREFSLLKQARTDLQTGLFNLNNFYALLESSFNSVGSVDNGSVKIVLVELPPRKNRFREVHLQLTKCSHLLSTFLQKQTPLHYLGQATYGLIFSDLAGGELPGIESTLVSFLKNEGCKRVHVGSSRFLSKERGVEEENAPEKLLDEAWTALQRAEKRGPFSFCEHHLLAYPEDHPLAPPSKATIRRLSRYWSVLERFSIVLFNYDKKKVNVGKIFERYVQDQKQVSSEDGLYVVMEGDDMVSLKKWAGDIVSKIAKELPVIHISVGISCYPFANFTRSETAMNSRKAISHAAFFGPGSVVVFDAVSLNISGDQYFADGDFTAAIKDYRRGIECDNREVNLHNSLGVTLAMMGRLKQAIACFNLALAIDQSNFMALYNAGLAMVTKNDSVKALDYLEKASEIAKKNSIDHETENDLQYQLGKLYLEVGKSTQALTCLTRWHKKNSENPRSGKVFFLIGQAHYGSGENRSAMTMLQKALGFNEFDDRAMSLLGKIYMLEGQGVEVALALCQKSVELAPDDLLNKLFLAEVLIQADQFQIAKVQLRRCLRSKKYQARSQLLMGKGYERSGKFQRAISWYQKVTNKVSTGSTKLNCIDGVATVDEARNGVLKCEKLITKERKEK